MVPRFALVNFLDLPIGIHRVPNPRLFPWFWIPAKTSGLQKITSSVSG